MIDQKFIPYSGEGALSMNEAILILKKRLAAGEIDLKEYQKLLPILSTENSTNQTFQSPPSSERLVAAFEKFSLFKTYLLIGSEKLLLENVIKVSCDAQERSFNFITDLRHSSFSVKFRNGDEYGARDDNTSMFKKERHKLIRQFGPQLQMATSQSRMNNIAADLRSQGKLLIGAGNKSETDVYLTATGKIMTSIREFDIKSCASNGTFGIGTVSYRYQSPREVLISQSKKPLLGYGKESLSFNLSENSDVLKSLMEWMAKPGNSLL